MSPTPHQPLDAAEADTGEEIAVSPGRARQVTTEYRAAQAVDWKLVSVLAGLVLAVSGVIGHAYVLSDHVAQLDAARAAELAQHEVYETRMRTIEATVIADRASADKREALIEQQLGDITQRLDAIKVGVDQLQAHHH